MESLLTTWPGASVVLKMVRLITRRCSAGRLKRAAEIERANFGIESLFF